MTDTDIQMVEKMRGSAQPLTGTAGDYDPLMDLVGDARFVLLGEATHGTQEFYRERAEITKLLIKGKDFSAVAVEADWPDAYHVNRHVRNIGHGATDIDALSKFKRFPTWMWRNTDVLDFVRWLRSHNDSLPKSATKIGFYGLDLYSLYTSIEAVTNYLDKVDPEAARRAREYYSCFERFGEDPQAYGYAISSGVTKSCEDEAIKQLLELQQRAAEYAARDGRIPENEYFYAEQNARLTKNAEEYYRSMFSGRVLSWNLRDRHMAETIDSLASYLSRKQNKPAKVVVWGHNSHIGDARATEMGKYGELNVGQLVRERYGHDAVLVGFTTYDGTVTAASNWGAPPERKRVRPVLPESYEALFHRTELPQFLLNLRHDEDISKFLSRTRLERAIGVIYLPETERASHYFYAQLSGQFDAVIHFDKTRAVEPLERTAEWEEGEIPDTFPSAL